MRIAIVNDLNIAVESLRRALLTVPEYQVAWVAQNGEQAVTKCLQDRPDLILMDLIMPVMDGVEATRAIMQQSPCAILIVTASVHQNAGKVFTALGYGALDAVSTPVLGKQNSHQAIQALLNKITTIRQLKGLGKAPKNTSTATSSASGSLSNKLTPSTLVVIGASTGGPKALSTILAGLPAHFPAAMAIIQHIDREFSAGLVEWLNQQTPLEVKIATEGDRLSKGQILVAATNDHLYLKENLTLSYTPHPQNYPYRPSVDVFFESLAKNWGRKGTAVLLTGMGKDGASGLKLLRSKGWHTIAQDQATSVVYGMPKAAAQLNAAVQILPLEAIISTLIQQNKRG